MKTAMILAAGRGERLKPLTNSIPKAMCAIQGIPLIEYHVKNLAKSGFQRIIVNHAYLGDQIRRYLGDGGAWGIDICYSPEPPGGLETGGGIYNALPLLGDQPFLTVNADILTDYDFSALTIPDSSLAHLILINNPVHNAGGDFDFGHDNLLTNNRRYTFLGIACYRPQAFSRCRPGRYSVTPTLRTLVDEGSVSGELFAGHWLDIGSMARLNQTNEYGFKS
ncbi:N-acetylmuramate alpha-1-phosphate uridylyltransferase MurU [Legionella spiritensis]|uniref:Nucleotidyltransferase n=1 Tax=Legionella spiritensis TaxID=452 RepID=A0A0W0Z856_LEGSP|nr:nucleotidyltransferase family protein [Legionella spiritensis]KTD65300.1 nucleotidyltransferase [Legionella spiritensis]SNV29998.1 nucleotidyltransferase [Legionella spiritensis]